MLVTVSELTGIALDWAVAKCEGQALLDPNNNEWEYCWNLLGDNSGDYYSPSTNWEQGGPLIDSAGIAVSFGPQWTAVHNRRLGHCYYGPTPLIAICRCYVASKLGDTVDIPDELFKGNKC